MTNMADSQLKTVISGSYRKHLTEILKVKAFLEKQGISILAPTGSGVSNPGEEFVILDEDPITDPRTLEDSFLAKMRTSSFLVLANVGGYIGKAAVFEMGYAVSIGIQILTLEPVDDPNLARYCRAFEEVFPTWKVFQSENNNPLLIQEA